MVTHHLLIHEYAWLRHALNTCSRADQPDLSDRADRSDYHYPPAKTDAPSAAALPTTPGNTAASTNTVVKNDRHVV
ncbi:MAG: hypothetical protein ACYDCO_15385 [Armatimonadota bacterium]